MEKFSPVLLEFSVILFINFESICKENDKK